MAPLADVIPLCPAFQQLEVRFDSANEAVWCYLRPAERPCFSPQILEEVRLFQSLIWQLHRAEAGTGNEGILPRYIVNASRTPGIYNLGGDLCLFVACIRAGNKEALRRYAHACIDVLYQNYVGFGLGLTTISLIQGEALGGGFEGAISSNVVIAEESARFGMPEILFNLFPGMGAYSILLRKLGAVQAERMIRSGGVYTAAQMQDLGLVDEVVPDGQGERSVVEYVRKHRRRRNAHQALAKVRELCCPLPRQELLDVADLWAEAALGLEAKDLRLMERLARAQDRRRGGGEGAGVREERA